MAEAKVTIGLGSAGTKIEWADATFNPWWGCTRVSPACNHCYAEALAKRYGHGVWGKHADRRFFGDRHWAEPLKWNRRAERAGVRYRVFCASMADVFEDHDGLDEPRARLWDLIEATPHLDWMLLTKRPENINRMAPSRWADRWPANVWAGTTTEDQQRADERLPHLLGVPAAIRFISYEPALGPLDLDPTGLQLVIAGGETGPGARPAHAAWFRAVRDRCVAAGVAFHFKQWGDHRTVLYDGEGWPEPTGWVNVANGRTASEDEALADGGSWTAYYRLGKKAAGRVLDGRTWDEMPEPVVAS
jgi:protein gp37